MISAKELGFFLPIRLIALHNNNKPVSQIAQCTSVISHNAPFCNRNVHMCAHSCYKIVYCGIFVWCIVGFVSITKETHGSLNKWPPFSENINKSRLLNESYFWCKFHKDLFVHVIFGLCDGLGPTGAKPLPEPIYWYMRWQATGS